MTRCLLFVCRCETVHRVNSIKLRFSGVKLCASAADITGRPVPAAVSKTSVILCALIVRTSHSASAHLRPSWFAGILTFLLTNT